MFKKNIKFPVTYFFVLTGWQLIANKEVKWLENFFASFIVLLILLAYDWSKVPYKWKKGKNER
nr:hypothetical protein [Lysinibacillus timonensis]